MLAREPESLPDLIAFIYAHCFKFLGLLAPESSTQNDLTSKIFAEDLIANRPDWKPEDVLNLFKWLRNDWQRVHTKVIDIVQLNEAVREYEEIRSEAREQLLQERFKKPENEQKTEPKAADELRKIRERLEQSKKRTAFEFVKREKTEEEEFVEQVRVEFVKIRTEQLRDDRFIKLNGKLLDFDEFLIMKIEEK
jgi:hypothetical protein